MAKTVGGSPRPYHHGDLKAAMLEAADTILERDGVDALSLRAAARAVGVSHAAPANHFGDLSGLLSELAALGYSRFSAALAEATAGAGDNPREAIDAMGRAYVAFARAHPQMFALMFRSNRLNPDRPALREAADGAARAMRAAAMARAGPPDLSPLAIPAQIVARWSLVHGFAMLLLDGRLDAMIGPGAGFKDIEDLLDGVLSETVIGGQAGNAAGLLDLPGGAG